MFANKHFIGAVGVLLLAILMAEWTSHLIIESHDSLGEAPTISAPHGGHDLCKTLICSDSGSRDQRNWSTAREPGQHARSIDPLSALTSHLLFREHVSIDTDAGDALFRPPDPPFQPPQTS